MKVNLIPRSLLLVVVVFLFSHIKDLKESRIQLKLSTNMGVYDPSRDKDLPVEAVEGSNGNIDNPRSLSDTMKSLFSKTNDITSSSFNRMWDLSRGLFNIEPDDNLPSDDVEVTIDNNPIFNTLKNIYGSVSRPNGYVTYPVPSDDLYSKCKQMDGLAAWDGHGYWHCIFPRAKIPEEAKDDPESFSKEDVEDDWDHKKYGVFFKNFNDMMDWRAKMRDVIKTKQQQEWNKYKDQEKSKWDFLNGGRQLDNEKQPVTNSSSDDIYDVPGASTSHLDDKGGMNDILESSTGTMSSTVANTLENGDIEKTTKVRRYFNDGSSEEREYKEIIDAKTGKSKTVDQNVMKYPKSGLLKKGGWFWSKKGGDKEQNEGEDKN